MCLSLWISLTLWASILEQNSYLSYIKEDDKKDTASYRSISFLNLDYIIYISFLKIACKKSVIIGEKRNFIIRLYGSGSTASRL